MLYLSGSSKNNLIGVRDTEDNVEEFFSKDILYNSGLEIVGLNISLREYIEKYDELNTFSDGIMEYTLKDDGLHAKLDTIHCQMAMVKVRMNPIVAGEKVVDLSRCFESLHKLKFIEFDNFDTRYVKDMSNMFKNCFHLIKIDLSSFNTKSLLSLENMFYGCEDLEEINFGSNFNVSGVENFEHMFHYCRHLKSLDLTCFHTRNGEKFSYMFGSCSHLKSILAPNLYIEPTASCSYMLLGCDSLKYADFRSCNSFEVSTNDGVVFIFKKLIHRDYVKTNMVFIMEYDSHIKGKIKLSELNGFLAKMKLLNKTNTLMQLEE